MKTADQPFACDTGALQVFLRGELDAVESYTHVLVSASDEELVADLQKIRDDHSRAARELRDCVVEFGMPLSGQPNVTTSGTSTLAVGASLAALREAEKRRARDYEEALASEAVHPSCHALIHSRLLPACRKHVAELTLLIESGAGDTPGR